jgi:copper resistance protein B
MRLLVAAFCLLWPAAADAQQPSPVPAAPTVPDHSAHQPAPAGDRSEQGAAELPPFIPPLTDADRAAAFPDVMGHSVHDNVVNYFVLFDQLEWQGSPARYNWDTKGWVGKDRDRLWFRTEGEGDDHRFDHAELQAFYGRAIGRWWDVVAGVRQDLGPGASPQTWAAVGLQGLAPYWFEVEATAYVGGSGRTAFRVETEYELFLTNRLILQPLVEFEVHGKADPGRGIGAGLSSGDAGLRLRYLIRRELAPYVGVVWNRKFFGTADFTRAAGDPAGSTRVVLGLRVWM